MEKVFEIINKRDSVRTYSPLAIEEEKREVLSQFFDSNTKGPFGNSVRFKLVDIKKETQGELKKYVSYGNIKGAHTFIVGAVKKGSMAMEDFGYCMQKNVLMATSLGLGTVWLGGSINRSSFADSLKKTEDELIPAITPLGYGADKRSMMDKVISTVSGGKNRLAFEKLFFSKDLSSALTKENCKNYKDPLEAVRLAPSASNKQPWRIVKDKKKDVFHFYMNEHPSMKKEPSNPQFKGIHIQHNDMGIAMCHFELTATELGLNGRWEILHDHAPLGDLVYVVSWIAS